MTWLTDLFTAVDALPLPLQLLVMTIGVGFVLVGALAVVMVWDAYTNPIYQLQGLPTEGGQASVNGVPETATGRARGDHSPNLSASSFNGQDSGPSIRGSEFDSPRRYQRDPLLFRDQVREDMKRSLKALQGGRR